MHYNLAKCDILVRNGRAETFWKTLKRTIILLGATSMPLKPLLVQFKSPCIGMKDNGGLPEDEVGRHDACNYNVNTVYNDVTK